MVGEGPQEEPTKGASKAEGTWIALAVLETPGGKIERCEIVGEESVASSKSDGVTEDSTTDGVSRAEASTVDQWFGFLSLETDIQLQIVDIAVQQLGRAGDLRVRVPLEEGAESCSKASQSLTDHQPECTYASIQDTRWKR